MPGSEDDPVSITLSALLVVAAAVAAALAGRAVLRRLIPPARVVEAQPTADVVMEAMAGLYGVLLAFILAGAWERLDQARAILTREANALLDLRQVAQLLPEPTGDEFGSAIDAYRESVREELRFLADARTREEADAIVGRLWQIVAAFEPRTPGQAQLQSRALEAVEELGNQRRVRLLSFQRPLPRILWAILFGGAAAVVGLAAITSIGGRLPAVYLALLAAVISFALFATWVLSHPVRSGLAEMAPIFEHGPR